MLILCLFSLILNPIRIYGNSLFAKQSNVIGESFAFDEPRSVVRLT